MERDDLEMIADALARILRDAPLGAIDEAGGLDKQADTLWTTLEENGYPMLCVSQDHGGLGANLADICPIAILAGRHAAPLPLADTMLAQGLFSASGAEPVAARIAVADPLAPTAPVPYAGQADHILMLRDRQLTLASLTCEQLRPAHQSEDGSAYCTLSSATTSSAKAPDWLTPQSLRALAALVRSAQMAGAMQAVLDLTLGFTQEREQFGRPLAKFQAIQHHLSDIACETAASIAAVEMAGDALRAVTHIDERVIGEIAIAKIRCGEAATRVSAAAHQAHGAIGFTREYPLGRFTRRLWQWQDEYGGEREWAIQLGHSVLSSPQPQVWPRISQPV